MTNNPPISDSRSWEAKLDLIFECRNSKTALTGKQHSGPLMVQKPFYPESKKCCHVYIIHPPGGIVGGDSLTINASLSPDTHALLTTPAATKFYKSNNYTATQNQTISLSNDAIFEWLPQETVYFNGAQARAKTRINVSENSKFIAWEIQCLGLPANQEEFNSGFYTQKLEIWNQHKPLLLECNRITGGDKILSAPWGLNQCKAIGTLVFNNPDNMNILEIIKGHLKIDDTITTGCTSFNGFVVVRAMALYAEPVKELFISIWELIRPYILKLNACPPRIWQT